MRKHIKLLSELSVRRIQLIANRLNVLNLYVLKPMNNPSFENPHANFWIEAGILYFVYKPNTTVDLTAAKQIVSDRINFQHQIDYPIFCDIRGMKSVDKAAREFLAKEGSSYTKGVAVVVDSPMTKIIGNFYLGLNKPLAPTKMFTEKHEALEYLRQFLS